MTNDSDTGSGVDEPGGTRVAVVLSGAAARGAFQAGALAEIVPALHAQGLVPTVWLGTSAGSINAALWGSLLHRGPATAAQEIVELWRSMSDDDVFRSLLPITAAKDLAQFAAGALLDHGPGLTSLLDTTPLQKTARERLNPTQLAANVADGLLSAVGVVATRMPADADAVVAGAASGRSVLFLDEHEPGGYPGDPDRALDVVRGAVTDEHVVASSAIPVAFPPIEITSPDVAAGWYVDGGVRLNTPLHPAVRLGATHIVVVSATSTTYGPPPLPSRPTRTPDIDDAAAQVLHAVLADRTTEDLMQLRRTNWLVGQASSAARGRKVLTSRGGEPYRTIRFLTVSPAPAEMGRIAADVFGRRTSRLGWLRETDNWLLGRLIRGGGDAVGRRELLSYLFFDEEYFAATIELGRRIAADALAQGWQT